MLQTLDKPSVGVLRRRPAGRHCDWGRGGGARRPARPPHCQHSPSTQFLLAGSAARVC